MATKDENPQFGLVSTAASKFLLKYWLGRKAGKGGGGQVRGRREVGARGGCGLCLVEQ